MGFTVPLSSCAENRPREAGSEEYLDSEKYEIKRWEIERADSLKEFIGLVNRIRRENPALHRDESLHFHTTDNDQLICYSKSTPDGSNVILVLVNLSPYHTHSGWVQLDLDPLVARSASSLPGTGPADECLLSVEWTAQLCRDQSALRTRPYFPCASTAPHGARLRLLHVRGVKLIMLIVTEQWERILEEKPTPLWNPACPTS